MKLDKDKLIEVLSVQSYSKKQWRMFAYIIRQLKAMNVEYYTFNGCIYATKGKATSYPCMVAHMDTVHSIVSDLTVLDIDGNLTGFNKFTMRQTGIGGDDKVGIFIALQMLQKYDFMKVAFFRDEEIGCDGSFTPDNSFFWDVGFVLQCDRQGYGDFITDIGSTKLSHKDFQKAIKNITRSYGYKWYNGGMTDVMALKESGVDCAMANMACGYYKPHTDYEYVNVDDVGLVMNMVNDIIDKIKYRSFECKYEKPVYKTVYKGGSISSKLDAPSWTYANGIWTDSVDKDKDTHYDKWKAKHKFEDKQIQGVQGKEFWDASNGALKDWDDFVSRTEKKHKEPEVCQSCLEENKTTYIPEWRIEMCDKCVKYFMGETRTFDDSDYYGEDMAVG